MIEINNLIGNKKISKSFLIKIADYVLKKESDSWPQEIDLSIALVGPTRIKQLNEKYRQKKSSTDVLSFLYDRLGEIIICPWEVEKNAKLFNSNFEEELKKVLIHAILHLAGYDHEGKKSNQAKKMQEKEKYYLNKI